MNYFPFSLWANNNVDTAIGTKAPNFELYKSDGGLWRLSDHIGKVVTLILYPKNECVICTKQMCSIRDNWKEYLKTGAEVVAVSPGTVEDHAEFGQKYQLPLPILADAERKITDVYSFHRIFPSSFIRSIVVIDAKGIIRTKKSMLRPFRPTDRSVFRLIYQAKADALQEEYAKLTRRSINSST